MVLSQSVKERIVQGIKEQRAHYTSDTRHAKTLDISPSVYTNLKQGNLERQLSDAKWVSIARKLGITLREEDRWQVVETPTYTFITQQLSACQAQGLSALLCDAPNIGKSFSAEHYAKTQPNVAYIDCSQVKTKRQLVREIARAFGLNAAGKYYELYADLIHSLKMLDCPLIILDEAGDLQYEAFLELKALWNATEHCCGWYMMGADGLRAKIRRNIACDKVGYAEIFSRFGDNFRRISPEHTAEFEKFQLGQSYLVAQANAPEGTDYKALARRAGGLRRVYTEIMKVRKYGTA